MSRLLGLLALCVWPVVALAVAPLPNDTRHWSLRPVVRPGVPPSETGRNPIDAFLAARWRSAGVRNAPEADRLTLLRRATFDLIGLPPTPEEIAAFEKDTRPDAWDRVVERLLASPAHGERWAQHWLDVVRYAETNGYEADGERQQAWRYRDWVVASLNADKPYDTFVTEQLAGDLLAAGRPDRADLLIATGMNRCGPIHQVGGNVDPLEIRHELLNEMTGGIGAAVLGLTMGCARCHDHKFDPISQKDYFRLEAFFSLTRAAEVDLASAVEQATYAKAVALHQGKLAPVRSKIANLEQPYRQKIREAKLAKLEPMYRAALATDSSKRTPMQQKLVAHANTLLKVTWDEVVEALSEKDRERRSEWRKQIHALQTLAPRPLAKAWAVQEGTGKPSAYILKRGNIHRKGKAVDPGFPEVFAAAPPGPNNRLGLARWLTSEDHPLTARVIVNRLWQHHFGRGLVSTPNDFGLKGDPPSHPELLDWLATELVRSGWSLRHMHRLMVTSEAYRMSSRHEDAVARKGDPENRLLWRMNRRRLEGEALRDAALAVSGRLTPKVGGPMVRVPLEPEVYDLIFTEDEPDGLWLVTPDAREHDRRSLYLFNKRNVRQPLLEAFDQPDTLTSCAVRPVSTFAPQALILLNGPFMQEQSRMLAGRVWREVGADPTRQAERASRLVLGRGPMPSEARWYTAFLEEQAELLRERLRARQTLTLPDVPEDAEPARAAALADLCLALLNRNAFVYVE